MLKVMGSTSQLKFCSFCYSRKKSKKEVGEENAVQLSQNNLYQPAELYL